MSVGAAVVPVVVFLTVLFPRPAGEPQVRPPHFESLVEAEREFARRAGEIGVSDAFLEVLAEDGVVFNPGPVNGRELHSTSPWPAEYSLEWHPRVAAVSAAGDLGYTSGPYVFGASPDGEVSYGSHFSVWLRATTDDRWRLLLDVGTPHGRLEDQDRIPEVRLYPAAPDAPPSWSRDQALERLQAASGELHRQLGNQADGLLGRGLVSGAGAELVLSRIVVYRTGRRPHDGGDPLEAHLAAARGRGWSTQATHLAESQDLAVVRGEYRPDLSHGESGARDATGNFGELWVARDGGWRLAAFVAHVHPSR